MHLFQLFQATRPFELSTDSNSLRPISQLHAAIGGYTYIPTYYSLININTTTTAATATVKAAAVVLLVLLTK